MHSALYCGTVTHSRRQPQAYQFTYSIFLVYVDLLELAQHRERFPRWPLFGSRKRVPAFAWLQRRDHMKQEREEERGQRQRQRAAPAPKQTETLKRQRQRWQRRRVGDAHSTNDGEDDAREEHASDGASRSPPLPPPLRRSEPAALDDEVRRYVQRNTGGARPGGPIRLLTNLTYAGIGFNPVSFYYVFDDADEHVEYVVAEINNIPWFEQYAYVLQRQLTPGRRAYGGCDSDGSRGQVAPAVSTVDAADNGACAPRTFSVARAPSHAAAAAAAAAADSTSSRASSSSSSSRSGREPISAATAESTDDNSEDNGICERCPSPPPTAASVATASARTGDGDGYFIPFAEHPKAFHVSPFIGMDNIRYKWLFANPGGNPTRVVVELHDTESAAGGKFFGASLSLRRKQLSTLNLIACMVVYPLLTLKVMLAIHFEAAKLYVRGFHFYPHPNGTESASSRVIGMLVLIFTPLIRVVTRLLRCGQRVRCRGHASATRTAA